MAKESKYNLLDWIKVLLLPLILLFLVIWLVFFKDKELEVQEINDILSPDAIVKTAIAIADDLGTGWNWSGDEYDEDAAIKISKLNKVNWEGVKVSYKTLFRKDLTDDANRLLDSDIKLKYKSFLFPKGIL